MKYEYVDFIPRRRGYTRWQELLDEFFVSDQKIIKITLGEGDPTPRSAQSSIVAAARKRGQKLTSSIVDKTLYLQKA